MDAWKAMIRAQGGDPDAPLPVARHTEVVTADTDGYLTGMDAMGVGPRRLAIGCGDAPSRASPSRLPPASPGTPRSGTPSGRASRCSPCTPTLPERIERAKQALDGAVTIADAPVASRPIVLERISAG